MYLYTFIKFCSIHAISIANAFTELSLPILQPILKNFSYIYFCENISSRISTNPDRCDLSPHSLGLILNAIPHKYLLRSH